MPMTAPATAPATCMIAIRATEPAYGALIIESTVRTAQLGWSRRKASAQYKASKAARPSLIPDRTLRSPRASWSGQYQLLRDLAERPAKELRAPYLLSAWSRVMIGILRFQWASSLALC